MNKISIKCGKPENENHFPENIFQVFSGFPENRNSGIYALGQIALASLESSFPFLDRQFIHDVCSRSALLRASVSAIAGLAEDCQARNTEGVAAKVAAAEPVSTLTLIISSTAVNQSPY